MSAAEVNFTFNGLHCLRDFGCVFIEDSTRVVTPQTELDEYTIAGHSGSILMGDIAIYNVYTIAGSLVPMRTPRSMTEAQALARRLAEWLKSGRHTLAWDYEPGYQHEADVPGALEWDTQVWMDGGLRVAFQVQPFTWDAQATTACASITAGTSKLSVPVHSPIPCPVSLRITATGSISSVRVETPEGKAAALAKGMALAAGDVLTLDMETPIGATITRDGAESNALCYATRLDWLTITNGEPLTITTNGPADVVAKARGCRP